MAFPPPFRVPRFARAWPFVPPVLAGLLLRIWGLSGQILLDDEWHSLNFVLDKTFLDTLATHGLGANCIPQNALNWLLLHTVGWSEIALFAPAVLSGVLGLLIFPGLVSRLAGRSVALWFSWLFALSPCVIFYSRIVRPYSMVLFFGFLSLLHLGLWIRAGRRRHLVGYVLAGFAAIYFHLYAALPVLAPLAAQGLLALGRRQPPNEAPWLSLKALLAAGLAMAGLLAIFLGPAHWQNPWWLQALARDRVTARGLWDFLSLLAGTGSPFGKLLFAALAGTGLRAWLGRDFRGGLLWASVWGAFFLLLIFATQDGMHAGIQIARYNIVLFPVATLLAAGALDALLGRLRPAVQIGAGVLVVGGLAAGSPLWRTLAPPNNFMHHSAFQDSYAPFDWSQSRLRLLTPLPQMPAARIPPYYAAIAADPRIRGIVEYPMYVGDPLNFHYFYQHVHRKPVAVGYEPDAPFAPLPSRNDYVYQVTPVDYVFSRARACGLADRMRFRNLVSLADPDRLRRDFSGWLLIIHRDVLRETLNVRLEGGNAEPTARRLAALEADFGPPAQADAQLLAWRIP